MRGKKRVAFDCTVRAHAGMHVECTAGLEDDWPDDHLAGFQFDEADRGSLRQGNVVTDVEQIPPTVAQLNSTVDVNALADPGPEGAKRRFLVLGPFEQPPRDARRSAAHDPVFQPLTPPHRHPNRLVATNETPLHPRRIEDGG